MLVAVCTQTWWNLRPVRNGVKTNQEARALLARPVSLYFNHSKDVMYKVFSELSSSCSTPSNAILLSRHDSFHISCVLFFLKQTQHHLMQQ